MMGLECVKVMNSLTILTVEDEGDPEKILTALGNHFMPKKHLLFERVKFGYANQTEHETIDQYLVRLRQLAAPCLLHSRPHLAGTGIYECHKVSAAHPKNISVVRIKHSQISMV